MISIFGDGLAGCLVCGFLFGLGVVFCCLVACLVCFPHGRDLLFLLNCVRIVCNLERPSELSWRARHGKKKYQAATSKKKTPRPCQLYFRPVPPRYGCLFCFSCFADAWRFFWIFTFFFLPCRARHDSSDGRFAYNP